VPKSINDLSFSNSNFLSDDEERKKESPYWHQKLRYLIEEVDFNKVSKNISLLQFNPYHSLKFREIAQKYFKGLSTDSYLSSQIFGFQLLKNCIEQGKLIVVLRSKEPWFKAVSELKDYEQKGMVITINNKRQPFLSPNNFETENGYKQLVQALK